MRPPSPSRTVAAGIAAREQYLSALRRHEADLDASRRDGKGAYALVGLIARIARTIEDEAYLSLRENRP